MTYPAVPLGVRIRISPFAIDPTADPSTFTWIDVSSKVAHLEPIVDTIGSADESTESATEFECVFKNDNGDFTNDFAESPYYPYFDTGCPIEYAINTGAGYVVQTITYIGSITVSWTANTQYKCIASVTAGGQFRRLGLDPPIASPVARTVLSRRRKAVWMCEDPAGSTQASSQLQQQLPLVAMVGVPPEFGQAALVSGVASMVKFSAGQNLSQNLSPPTTSPGVRLSFLLRANTIPPGAQQLAAMFCVNGATIDRYVLDIGPGYLQHRTYTAADVEVSGAGTIGFTTHQTACIWLDWDIVQTAATTLTWTLRETRWQYDAAGLPTGSVAFASGTFAGVIGSVRNISIAPNLQIDDMIIGAINVSEQTFPVIGGTGAVLSWAGNKATERVAGMCGEFKVPYSVTATNLGSALGPQLNASLLANLRDIQAADHGVLTDHLGVVAYRALVELYNLAPAFTLSRAVRGQLGVLNPVRDDVSKVNIASASRPNGGTFTASDLEDVLRAGPYEREPIAVNVLTDSALPGHAGWALARGATKGQRWDGLTINMRVASETTPALPAQVLALKLGDRIAVSSLPPQASKDGFERQVRGRKQTVINRGFGKWEVAYQLVPVDPYNAFVLDSSRLDAAGAEMFKAATTTDTVLVASLPEIQASVGGPSLTIPLVISGERVTLNTVANEATADAFTRTVANGWGSMPATANAPAQPWSPVSGIVGDYATTGTTGTMTNTTGGGFRSMHMTGLILKNWDLTVFASYAVLATGANLELQAQYRNTASVTGYVARITISTAAAVRLQLFPPGSTDTIADIPLALTHTAGVLYGMRILAVGTRHRIKVWQGVTEPVGVTSWQLDIQDDTKLYSGWPVLRAGRAVGNTNAGAVATWDNVTFNGIQAFTVVRSANGVVKAQAVGNPIHAYTARGLGI